MSKARLPRLDSPAGHSVGCMTLGKSTWSLSSSVPLFVRVTIRTLTTKQHYEETINSICKVLRMLPGGKYRWSFDYVDSCCSKGAWLSVEEDACQKEMWVRSRGQEDLEKEVATHSSILAWRIPGREESSGLWSIGLQRIGHDWSDLACKRSAQ